MKNKRILRLTGITIILLLLFTVIPTATAFGAVVAAVTPSSAQIGASVTASASGYVTSISDTERFTDVYITDQAVTTGMIIDTNITRYAIVAQFTNVQQDGTSSISFIMPATLNQGASGTTAPLTLTAGTILHVIFTNLYLFSGGTPPSHLPIAAYTNLTVAQGPTLDPLSTTTGTAGTDVTVSGYSFPASTALVYTFDTTTIVPKSGHTTSTGGGSFLAVITIPATATPGAHTITVTAGAGTASASFTVSAPAALNPLSPVTGPAGTDVIITGANWPANGALIFQFNSVTLVPKAGSLQAGSDGSFTTIVTVPAATTAGAYLFTVTSGTTSKTTSFTVTGTVTTTPPATTPPATTPPATTPPATTPPATTPVSTTTPTYIPISAAGAGTLDFLAQPDATGAVSLFGTGYTPNGPVVFKYDGVKVTTTTATAKGIVSAQITLPASSHGDHQISASDGINTGVLNYAVESIPPAVPSPLVPGMNAKVKSPIKFDWGDVTDPSLPVTYNLQISTDTNFATAAIVINKTKLTKSEYTLTELEAAQLNSSTATYYWREQAVDGAQNESAWTGAGAFTVSQPLKFAGWPMYAVMAGLFVVGFLIGLVLGRRTAFGY
jgi:hypothetical protein